jgi:WD40-like Beta Propeller Repeat
VAARRLLLSVGAASLALVATACGAGERDSLFAEGDVLFVRDGAIYAMPPEGGAERRVVEGHSPRWSPDGARFAYLADETGDPDGGEGTSLWVLESGDGGRRRVLGGKELGVDGFAWAPDGTRLAVSDGLGISIASLDGGAPNRLSFASELSSSLDWSPDGRELLAAGLGEVVALDVASHRTRVVSPNHADGDPRWSPDGELIALTRRDILGADGSWLLTIDRDGRETELTSGFEDGNPAWSSDGERLYFSRAPKRGDGDAVAELDEVLERTEIYVLDLKSREVTRLTENAAYDTTPEPRPADRSLPDPPEEVEGDVVVPDLVRREIDFEQEQRRFAELGLELRAPDAVRDGQSVLLVIEQAPKAGTRVRGGTAVELLALDASDPFAGRRFSSAVWKAHPHCDEDTNPRGRMYADLAGRVLENGMTRARVLALLGPPDRTEGGALQYPLGFWSGFGIDCDYLAVELDRRGVVTDFFKWQS